MSDVTLHYFDGRGKGEIIRFMLSAAGIQFNEDLITERKQMEKFISDEVLDFNQLPLLDIDELRLVQTGAIVRYVARKGGLYGKEDKEAALIDKFFEGSRDFNAGFMPLQFRDKDEILKIVKDTMLPRYLSAFEKALARSGTGYLVGVGLTMADVGLFEAVSNTVEFIGPDSIKDFPKLQQFYQTVKSLPRISGFLSGPQRKRPNDERYVTEVSIVLNRTI